MQALTKKRHTEAVELKFIGPVSKLNQALEAMKSLGFVDASDYVPWREAFPDLAKNEHGTVLRGARFKEELTQTQLAERVGIPQRHISEMENGKRPIGKEMAKRLGKALNIGYKVFL
jgi:ribosome-binding protein aMBF1 (putative translation factor)